MTRTVPPDDAPLRILAWPAFRTKGENPYNWLLYSHMRAQGVVVDEYGFGNLVRGKYDVFHLHWPEWQISHPEFRVALLRFLRLRIILWVARRKGMRIAWTVHNMRCHENFHPRLGARFYDSFIPFVDGYVSLSTANLAAIRERFPGLRSRPCTVALHGHYRGVYPDDVTREAARERLGIGRGEFAILQFGAIRPYKNAATLIREFRKLERKDCVLLVVGRPMNREMETEIRNASSGESRVRLTLRFVEDEEVQFHFKAADLVVLPSHENWNSGSAMLALSFNRPVLLPAVESTVELQGLIGADWIGTYEGPFSAEVLERGIAWATRPGGPGEAPLGPIDWDSIAATTRTFFLALSRA